MFFKGKNANTSGVGFTGSADIRQITDGSWKDAYVHNEIDELADLFCTNNGRHGESERWIQVDLEKSVVICAVDFYNRAGKRHKQLLFRDTRIQLALEICNFINFETSPIFGGGGEEAPSG